MAVAAGLLLPPGVAAEDGVGVGRARSFLKNRGVNIRVREAAGRLAAFDAAQRTRRQAATANEADDRIALSLGV